MPKEVAKTNTQVQIKLLNLTEQYKYYITIIMANESINLIKWDTTIDGKLSDASMEEKLQRMGYHSIKYTFSPGTDFPDHTHNVTKMDAITTGKFFFSMHGQNLVMEPGDIVEVPKQVVHNAHVVGSESVTFFDSTKR
ncbi:hypothetical protein EGW08_001579 [Elysia chlorotica]|uniref:Cupin type-2 domain-containing protein n=1 Tax=Elysia chlorotica TaxID=188477 RepID=A0A3S1BT45_ELYCH|nr:hypothetical protein EGW08_001579 [Elysia chlorotica]